MLIGISGKIGSGKDTIYKIINYLLNTKDKENCVSFEKCLKHEENGQSTFITSDIHFENKKFADKLKDIVCLLIGCTREQLEDQDFKNKELGEEWIRYSYATGHTRDNNGNTTMLSTPCSKEKYEEEHRINWQTAYKFIHTARTLLQLMGTECGRAIIHQNIWVNALFADYIADNVFYPESEGSISGDQKYIEPDWIITDVRFPNEVQAIKDRGGILVRIDSNICSKCKSRNILYKTNEKGEEYVECENCEHTEWGDTFTLENEHESEIALDNYENWDYVIENNGTIQELVNQVKQILQKENIL